MLVMFKLSRLRYYIIFGYALDPYNPFQGFEYIVYYSSILNF